MKFAAVLSLATAVAGNSAFVGTPCGNNYGLERCIDSGAGNQNYAVGVCNDQHKWAVRQTCGGRFCCVDKPKGGAYCKC